MIEYFNMNHLLQLQYLLFVHEMDTNILFGCDEKNAQFIF